MRWAAASTALLLALVCGDAQAQGTNSFEMLRDPAIIEPGDTIYVTDAQGRRSKGRLERLQADSLLVSAGGRPRTYTPADVTRIQRGDHLANGMLIGLVAGVGTGLITTRNLCGTLETDDECALIVHVVVGIPSAFGGLALGALVDALIHKTIYDASGFGSVRIGVTPIIGPERKGVRVAVAF